MANCCNCSAPLPPNSIRCDYCGSRNDTDLKGVHYFTTHETDSERICPRCGIALRTIDLKIDGKFLIERCDQCLGLFFDPGELEALLDATVSNVFTINRERLESINVAMRPDTYGVSYVKCPVCSRIMNRVNYGAKSGVVVDRCKDHGVWLDGGELRHLFEWMKAGGKLLDQERREEQKKLAAEQERRAVTLPSGAPGGWGDSPDETVFTLDHLLVAAVREVVRFFRS
ncbi:zf-TFIIB domain-containing protein [Geobacter sp.]|uniref:zf-TFIIB domain-containing protein n=1 Tax=Geobacter sp. TaxID=46610 RepID=UPI00260DB173|nr:zf-TFIIB domain-containing protein [Geobacter sp.]